MTNIAIPGIKLLDMGQPGAGKTYGLRTIPEEYEVFILFTEQSQAIIADRPNMHWHYLSPVPDRGWEGLRKVGESINRLKNEDLQKSVVSPRSNYIQWLEMIDILNNFTDDRTEKEYGDVADWGTDRVLVIDGLSGVTKMSRSLQAGIKPLLTQPDFGVIMQNISFLLDLLTANLKCHLVLIAHVEIERDEINGGTFKTVSTIGRKLAPTIPALFDDCVLSQQTGGTFVWTTIEDRSTTKARLLPLKEEMPHDYSIIFDSWKDKGGKIVKTEENK